MTDVQPNKLCYTVDGIGTAPHWSSKLQTHSHCFSHFHAVNLQHDHAIGTPLHESCIDLLAYDMSKYWHERRTMTSLYCIADLAIGQSTP
jgi:hypothetical protein